MKEDTDNPEWSKKFTDKYILNHDQLSVVEQNKLVPKIIQHSISYLFELFTFYVFYKEYKDDYDIELNLDKNNDKGEKDVVLIKKDKSEVILVECKLTPINNNIEELISNLNTKIKKSVYDGMLKSIQLWFWNEPTPQNFADIEKYKKDIII